MHEIVTKNVGRPFVIIGDSPWSHIWWIKVVKFIYLLMELCDKMYLFLFVQSDAIYKRAFGTFGLLWVNTQPHIHILRITLRYSAYVFACVCECGWATSVTVNVLRRIFAAMLVSSHTHISAGRADSCRHSGMFGWARHLFRTETRPQLFPAQSLPQSSDESRQVLMCSARLFCYSNWAYKNTYNLFYRYNVSVYTFTHILTTYNSKKKLPCVVHLWLLCVLILFLLIAHRHKWPIFLLFICVGNT